MILNKEKILEQARLFAQEGKYDRALREYEKILASDPSDARVKLRLAEMHARQKQIAEAIRIYREVATQYATEGFYLKAVTAYKNVLRLNPSLVETNQELAELYERMGLHADAVRQYDIVVNALERQGDVDRVTTVRKRIVELDSENAVARTKLAELFHRQGKMEEALDQYEALALSLERRPDTASRRIELYEKILPHRPDRIHMLRELIGLYAAGSEKRKALKWLDWAKEVTPYDPELLKLQADIYASLNQLESARLKYLALAELYRERGEDREAIEAYGHIVVLLPDEEQRMREEVASLGDDAVQTLAAWIERRREDMAKEVARTEEKVKAEDARKQEVVARQERSKEELERQKRQEKIRKVQKGGVKTSPPKKTQEIISREDADAAYELGLAYHRMGLPEESEVELGKARDLYEHIGRGTESSDISARLTEIARLLSGKEGEVTAPPASEKRVEKKAKLPKEGGKKKISFV